MKFLCDRPGSSNLSSNERLHVLSGLFYILGWASPSLRQLLMQALQDWLASEPVAAAAENLLQNHQGMDAHMLVLGGTPHCMQNQFNLSIQVITRCTNCELMSLRSTPQNTV